ncbi:MAG: hypothetical protein KDD92_00645 [Caldilineaceae bacterium]|nr:hypothetical protein [Caldilineaceae bacterium]
MTEKTVQHAIDYIYKNLNFRLVGPIQDKPIVFDDTVNFGSLGFHVIGCAPCVRALLENSSAKRLCLCQPHKIRMTLNFLPFRTEDEARFVYKLLTSEPTTQSLESLIFWDEKRPITVKLLRQLSIRSIAMHLGKTEQYKYWASNQPPDESGQLRLGILETGIGYGKE